ncbi:MAG: hypothetical protein HJJLKODD_02593 [Phycisphaerae bacterium]|nr:hypothetical protein [Phycisphaerae bacterium]
MNIDSVNCVAMMQQAQQLGEIQFAAAAKMMKISNAQSQAVVELIESAAENMQQVSDSLGQMIDTLA